MAAIDASLVRTLRETTGAGMMDCKKALVKTDGDIDAATDWLRTQGLSKAAKKTGNIASDGLIGAVSDGQKAALIEVNTQTDFAARSDGFQKAVRALADLALRIDGDMTTLLAADAPDGAGRVPDMMTRLIATIGENIQLRRVSSIRVEKGRCAHYVHNSVSDGLGRIGVIVALAADSEPDALVGIGRKVAMHVAAANPVAASRADIDPEIAARERAILAEQARQSGKPDQVVEKMIEGRMNKYFKESVLLEQALVMDPDITVGRYIETASALIGAPARLSGYVSMRLGEGIASARSDFAQEVAGLR